MIRALVLGNGESRSLINLDSFKNTHCIIGCNAIHRDTIVDHLICCDQRMVRESLENINYHSVPIWVRSEWYNFFRKIQKNKNILELPEIPYKGSKRQDEPKHWGSGPYSILVALHLGFKIIDLAGFDLYGKDKKINNIYKGTKNYSGRESSAVDPSYWIYQISKMIEMFPEVQFNFMNRQDWDLPNNWKFKNVKKLNFVVDQNVNTLYNLQTVDLGIHPT